MDCVRFERATDQGSGRPGHPGQGCSRQSPRCAWVGAANAALCDPAARTFWGPECQGCLGASVGPALPTGMSATRAIFVSTCYAANGFPWYPNPAGLIFI